MNPKVSVIMSVYNGEKYLRKAVDSILDQTFPDFELIIINDGSTDGTKEILESYTDHRIHLIHQENIGLTKSLNKALKLARGVYIARQDADDISDLERLNCEVNYLNQNQNIGLLGSHVAFIDKKGREISVWKTPETHDQIKKGLLKGNCFCHGSVMFRKECLNTVGFYREKFRYAQDYDYWMRISEHFKTANIGMVLYKNRRTTDTISRKKLSEQLNYHLLAQQLMKERTIKGNDSLECIDTEDVMSELIKRYKMSKSEINKFKSNIFLRKFFESLESKDLTGAMNFWLKSMILEPQKWKTRLLIEKLLNNFK